MRQVDWMLNVDVANTNETVYNYLYVECYKYAWRERMESDDLSSSIL